MLISEPLELIQWEISSSGEMIGNILDIQMIAIWMITEMEGVNCMEEIFELGVYQHKSQMIMVIMNHIMEGLVITGVMRMNILEHEMLYSDHVHHDIMYLQ